MVGGWMDGWVVGGWVDGWCVDGWVGGWVGVWLADLQIILSLLGT
jgi:hypothetical protein